MLKIVVKHIAILLLLVSFIAHAQGQTRRIDNLRNLFLQATSLSEQKEIAVSMCEEHYSLSSDSLLKYISWGEKYIEPGSADYFRIKNFRCRYLFKEGKLHEGLDLSDSLIQSISNKSNNESIYYDVAITRANGLIRNGDSKQAIELSFDLLTRAEKKNDTLQVLKSCILLGWANMELNQFTEAIKWLSKGINLTNNAVLLAKCSHLFSNIASSYNNIGNFDSAYFFINKALKFGYAIENLTQVANALNIRADLFLNQKNYIAAEKDMKDALEVRKKIGDMLYVTSDMAQLSSFYASVDQAAKGIAIAKEGIELAKKENNLSKLIFLYSALAENYLKANQLTNYSNTLQTIINLKDSLYKKNSGDAIAEMEVKYNLQKQQNIIITQNYALTRTRYLIIGSLILLLLGGLLGWALYRNYRLSEQKKMESALAQQKLLSYKAVELARENERKRIAADLHDNLGSYAAAIKVNVKYLQDNSGVKNDNFISQLDANAQSMVTQLGDTIWVLKNEYLPITGLADRFKLWVLRLMQNYPHIRYNYNERIEKDIEFTPARILHIFLMLKECVNNALKHSNCTEMRIDFYSSERWEISIQDNGKGFEPSVLSRGSGINNIKNRAKESGWTVEWQKLNPAGTKVIISGNLPTYDIPGEQKINTLL